MKYATDQDLQMGKWLGGALVGALVMYMLDPERGATRRAQSGQRLRELGHQTGEVLDKVVHGMGDGMDQGRSAAASMASEAGSAMRGVAERAGAALAPLASAFEGSASGGGSGSDQRTAGWGRSMRGAALAGGGALGLYSLLSPRSPVALGLGLTGLALIARGASNRPLGSMISSTNAGKPVAMQSAVHVDASPEQLFDLFADQENLPRFMSNVIAVRDLGNRRTHWKVRGPAGTEFEWDAVVTEQTRPRRLAWHSEAGADVQQSGTIEFEPERGGTRVMVRMMYWPPAGGLGHALASVLGKNPRQQMEDDLARLKSLFERGAVPHAGARATVSEGKVLH
jgi:uncharacterized membrane protein